MSDPTAPLPSPWPRRARTGGRWALRVALALGGALVAVLLFARVNAPIGPFDTSLAFRPAGGGAQVAVPPLGAVVADVYDGPLRLEISLTSVDQARVTALASDPVQLSGVVDQVSADLREAIVELVVVTVLVALAGAALVSWAVLHRRREPLIAVGIASALVVGTAGLGAATWRPEALLAPRSTGLLVNASSLIGSVEDVVTRFDAYRASLTDIVANVSNLYSTISALPAPGAGEGTVALLHVSDLHLNPAGFDLVAQVVDQFQVAGVLDTGDITDWGSQPENYLITSIGELGVPYVYVRGNHDSAATADLIAGLPNTTVLNNSGTEIAGLSVVGTRDPRFTPDKSTGDDDAGPEVLVSSGERLAEFVDGLDRRPDVALVHDPKQAPPLDGEVPVVLAGHTHDREVSELDGGTLLMVQGSTGGAGLRALQGEYPEPLTCTVLYFDADTGRLVAYDEITLGGLGATEATIERTVVPPDDREDGDSGDEAEDGDQSGDAEEDDAGADGDSAPASPTG